MPDDPGSDRRLPRVLLVANYESGVGYAWWLMENFWAVTAQAIHRGGGDCILAYPLITTVPQTISSAPVKIVQFAIRHSPFGQALESVRFIREHRVNAVYLTDWPYWHPCYLLWRIAGVRSIVIHDHSPGSRPPSRGLSALLKTLLHRIGIFSADRYVAVSRFVKERAVASARIPEERCMVVTNGIRTFTCDPDSRARVRAELGIPEDSIMIVLVSRATHYKNIGFAIRCIHQLTLDPEIAERVEVVHCGDGPELEEFRSLARELGLEKKFRLLGLRSDAREIMCAADLGLHTSHGEALSLAILEMMCAGLAVVASDLESVSSILEHEVTGLKYRHDDINDAVGHLRQLVADAGLRRRLGDNSSTVCNTRHSLETTNQEFATQVVPWLHPDHPRLPSHATSGT